MTAKKAHKGHADVALVQKSLWIFQPGFDEWLTDNMHVWRRFEAEASAVWRSGRKTYSARTIVEFLRHHTGISDTSPRFKIANNITPDLARLYVLKYPARSTLFRIVV